MMTEERHFIMKWPELDISVEVKPIEFGKDVYEWFLNQLPIRALQSHAVINGGMTYTNNLRLPERPPKFGKITPQGMEVKPVGRISIDVGGGLAGGRLGAVIVRYGVVPKAWAMRSNPGNAQVVDEDIEKLKEACRQIWDAVYRTKKVITVEFSIKK
jgi:hypothetical protein